jgi:hypothetical protein
MQFDFHSGFKTQFNSYKPGLSTCEKFHYPGSSTRELTKLNKTWIFDRPYFGFSQVLGLYNPVFTTLVKPFIKPCLAKTRF